MKLHYKRLRNNWIFIVAEFDGGIFNSHIMDISLQEKVYTSEKDDLKIFEGLRSDEAIIDFIESHKNGKNV